MSSAVHAAADRGLDLATTNFSLQAQAEPGVMPRVLELFAKRGLVPRRWHSTLSGPDQSLLSIDVQVAGFDRHTADYVANCMRQIAGVEVVLASES